MAHTVKPIGVVVGRFQVARPHKGHRVLIGRVQEEHDDVLVVLGVTASLPHSSNPLSYEMRKVMMEKEFPGILVASLRDQRQDDAWCNELDRIIAEKFPGRVAVLYGSRDSFLESYCGIHTTHYVPMSTRRSGTRERERIKRNLSPAVQFRRGIIHAQANREPLTYPAVDIAVVDYYKSAVLLGRKHTDPEGMHRFIGGFVDPTDMSYEAAAKRERCEETGDLGIGSLTYVGSHRVDDWRYRGTPDGIMTILFRAPYVFGKPEASDDIASVAWVPVDVLMSVLVPEHQPLGEMLLSSLNAEKQSNA